MISNRLYITLLAGLSSVLLITACGDGTPDISPGQAAPDSSPGPASLAAHDTRVPEDLARLVPMPEEASIRMSMEDSGRLIVMFSPGLNWPDALGFFSENLPAMAWQVSLEDIPAATEGERTAQWEAQGHAHSLRLSITTFGGEQGFNTTGHLMLEASADPQAVD